MRYAPPRNPTLFAAPCIAAQLFFYPIIVIIETLYWRFIAKVTGSSMARSNRSRRSSRRSDNNSRKGYRKSAREARIETITWALLVAIFGVLYFFPDTVPNWFTPLAGGTILIGSGLFQYGKGWRVSPVTWIGGTALLGLTAYSIYSAPALELVGPSLLVVAGVIGFGVLTGET